MSISFHRANRNWLFEPLDTDVTNKQIWLWWEKRRLFYNIVVIITAILSFAAYAYFLLHSNRLNPGEDIIEPIALIAGVTFGPILWNMAYCLGPIVDIAVHSTNGKTLGPVLLRLGLVVSVGVICLPAVYWAAIFFQQSPLSR